MLKHVIRERVRLAIGGLSLALMAWTTPGAAQAATAAANARGSACPQTDAGLQLPAGFCASVFADHVGHARHLSVSAAGVVYVNTWSGFFYGNRPVVPGGFLVALQDSRGTGHADRIERFGTRPDQGGRGGVGIAVYDGHLYAEEGDRIVRYALPAAALVPVRPAETIVSGLPMNGDHTMHPFLIDRHGALYMDSASATNACQKQNRQPGSPGQDPCAELATRAGIWRYDANRTDQRFSPEGRFATGIRNAEGLAEDGEGRIFVTQHGRDMLHSNWPAHYALEQEATLPAEELLLLRRGADYGWPECYFDPFQKRLVLAPEYGGDGQRVGECAGKTGPIAWFPAHWAPNAMVYYDSSAFPPNYRHGVFIAFHGSWNRAPFAQAGYRVIFQALDGEKAGRCELFADGFAGARMGPDVAAHRPTGLAVAPDGALFISDDVTGRIYRITYQGPADGSLAQGVPCPSATAGPGPIVASAGFDAGPGAGPSAAQLEQLPVPPGATRGSVVHGARIYHGAEGGAGCTGCHGESGGGSPLGPDLRSGHWLWSDGSPAGIAATIRTGVLQPRNFRSPMPALGGAQLSEEQVRDLAAYIWAMGHEPAAKPAARRTKITIPGERIFPESMTSTADGRIFVGSILKRQIFIVDPGQTVARPWTMPDDLTTLGVLGVLADEGSGTLWACRSAIPGVEHPAQSVLEAYALDSGRRQARYSLPTANALCNDIAVGPRGEVYATDSVNEQVLRLDRRRGVLRVWADASHFAPKAFIDGLAVLGGRVLVNAFEGNAIYAVRVEPDGSAGRSVILKLSRAIQEPDGMRAFGTGSLLLAEGSGRLTRMDVHGDEATLTTLREGLAGGPVAVTHTSGQVWVLEGQLQGLFAPPEARKPLRPFRALAVDLPSP